MGINSAIDSSGNDSIITAACRNNAVGTAAVVSPVKELVWKGEHAYIGDGNIGPVTQKLYDTMTGMQWGKIPDTKGWIVPVEKKY